MSLRVGDVANFAVLANTGLFLACVILDNLGVVPNLLSTSFSRDGFCVANPESKTTNSHVLCFYGDTVCALGFALLVRAYSSVPGIKGSSVEMGAGGILGHGIAHLGLSFVGAEIRQGQSKFSELGWAGVMETDVMGGIVGMTAFYYFLLRGAPNSQHVLPHALLQAAILVLLVPPKFGFTYVQTSLLWLAAMFDLRRPQKDVYYDLNALLISVPVGLVSWFEGLACDAFLGRAAFGFKAVGGHFWYDMSIPISMAAYCAVVLLRPPSKADKEA